MSPLTILRRAAEPGAYFYRHPERPDLGAGVFRRGASGLRLLATIEDANLAALIRAGHVGCDALRGRGYFTITPAGRAEIRKRAPRIGRLR